MSINLSGTCASTKLLQCHEMGVYECVVSQKFEQHPDRVVDLHRHEFLARKKVVDAVKAWVQTQPKAGGYRPNEYAPILYEYEVRVAFLSMVRLVYCVRCSLSKGLQSVWSVPSIL